MLFLKIQIIPSHFGSNRFAGFLQILENISTKLALKAQSLPVGQTPIVFRMSIQLDSSTGQRSVPHVDDSTTCIQSHWNCTAPLATCTGEFPALVTGRAFRGKGDCSRAWENIQRESRWQQGLGWESIWR